ncbi:MAG: T9SS type A sorting domain-containing protein [Ferruginibacter sp.]
MPVEPPGIQKWLEAECGKAGSNWDVLKDTAASNGTYVVVKSGLNSTATAPAGAASALVFSFTVDSAANYNFLARVNCPTADDDSYWIKVDTGSFATANGLATSGWGWVKLTNAMLSVGAHTLTIAYREDGAKLDKLLVTTSGATITGLGEVATNCSTLPVNLVSYQAALKPTGEVIFRWSTASEQNNKQYRLERSQNGREYTTIATIAGKGTFNGKSEYSYTDLKPMNGMNYYRLIQVDIDGNKSELGIRAVNITVGKTSINVYPNPAHSELNIDLGTHETTQKHIEIYNISGKRIFSRLLNVKNGVMKVNLDQHQGAGIYLVRIGDNDQVSVILK